MRAGLKMFWEHLIDDDKLITCRLRRIIAHEGVEAITAKVLKNRKIMGASARSILVPSIISLRSFKKEVQ